MSTPSWQVDVWPPRIDLIRRAAESTCSDDFAWIDDREAVRVTSDPRNQGFTAPTIRMLARAWICGGGEVRCVEERRENWRDRRFFHYDIVIEGIDEFPRGLYVEMELTDPDERDPRVSLLNAHPSTP